MIPATCGNCNAPLTGPYCAQCGQHAHESARTLGALFHDAWHVITHVDSRFWSTLWLLLSRPGQLTLEYFADRRARYVPPVRLYFVISIVFFGLASLTSRNVPVGIGVADDPKTAAELANIKREANQAAQEARQALHETAAQGAAPGAASAPTPRPAGAAATDAPARTPTGAADDDDDADGIFNFDGKDCSKVTSSFHWLEDPLRQACQRAVADHGKAVRHAFLANIPKMMFVFLPLIAFVMLLLYWFPRRYYVEHLVFVLHNHAALFLAMVLLSLTGLVVRLVPMLHAVTTVGGIAVFCYACWYVYRGMRRYYGQGRALTLTKLTLVGLAYLVCLVLMLIGGLVVSYLTA